MKVFLLIGCFLSIVIAILVITSIRFVVLIDFKTFLVLLILIVAGVVAIALAIFSTFKKYGG